MKTVRSISCGCLIRRESRWRLWISVVICALVASAAAQPDDASESATKRVEIDKTQQVLRAYEGNQLVLQSRISTGKWDRSTPTGSFRAQAKFRMHYSRLYQNAPMPFSVQVNGNVFIHGFSSVPAWPASHGCIRLPLSGDNPARRFYEWIEEGTPIEIFGKWLQKR